MKILKDLGYGDHFLIEVPLRGVPRKKGMEKALAHLAAAWDHFNEARDDETLGSCYKAFEYLAKQKKVKDPDQQVFTDPSHRRHLQTGNRAAADRSAPRERHLDS
ncbi:hypothetical protein MYX77_00855 [Acidobacteriia bacterium AH_259_A11_L15]|nr:hypothetical protein [Acidobacteriia bacterium AH_259_A11_L15]